MAFLRRVVGLNPLRNVNSQNPWSHINIPMAGVIQRSRQMIPLRGLEEFKDTSSGEEVGRAWSADELRAKSFDDLHSLWYVLLKERNMLDTLRHYCKKKRVSMPQPIRLKHVKQSMARLKTVVNQRNKEHKANLEKIKAEVEQELNPVRRSKPKKLSEQEIQANLGRDRKLKKSMSQFKEYRGRKKPINFHLFPVKRPAQTEV